MDNSPRRKSLSVLYALSLLAVIAVFVLPVTRWIAASQAAANFAPLGNSTTGWLRYTMGVKGDRQMDVEAIHRRILKTAASEPEDYGLQYAAIMMTPQMNDALDGITTIDYQLNRIRDLWENHRNLPRAYADFLRQACRIIRVGRNQRQGLASDYMTSMTAPASTSQAESTLLLVQMLASATLGIKHEPDNAFFPLMKSMVYFAVEDDQSALSELHAAARCTRYEDYTIEETTDLNHLAEKAFGKQSVITDITQSASVLLPHYAQIRGAVRLALVSAVEHEADNNKPAGLAIREDILKVGHLLRTDSRLMIGNFEGYRLQEMARKRLGGVPQISPADRIAQDIEQHDAVKDAARSQTKKVRAKAHNTVTDMLTYVSRENRHDLVEFIKQEDIAAKQLRTLYDEAEPKSIMGGTEIVRLGAYHTLGNILLANIFWLVLFGGLATFLLKRNMKSPRSAFALLVCWFGIALFSSWYNAPNQAAYGSAVNILFCFVSHYDPMDRITDIQAFSPLSAIFPFGIVLLVCIISLLARVPLSLGVLRGLRGLSIPTAAVLLLLWVPLTIGISIKERVLHSEYQQMLRSETQYLTQLRQNTLHSTQRE